jgi:hypothetical protein
MFTDYHFDEHMCIVIGAPQLLLLVAPAPLPAVSAGTPAGVVISARCAGVSRSKAPPPF